MAELDAFLKYAQEKNASDVIITTKCRPAIKLHGKIEFIEDSEALTEEQCEKYLYELMTDEEKKTLQDKGQIDFAYSSPEGIRTRCNFYKQMHGYGGVMRIIEHQVKPIDSLGLPPQVRQVTEYKNGLVLVTGSMGHGKSTTLAALVDEINANHPKHIVSVEDPIEMIHDNKKSIIDQREVGEHTEGFNEAFKAALRQNADVILIGELRDRETIKLALTAAETGSLVMATLHTNTAVSTVSRIISVFPPEEQTEIRYILAEVLRYVLWQRLIPSAKGGRVLSCELMINNDAIASTIRRGEISHLYHSIEVGSQEGMMTMNQSLDVLLENGYIDEDTHETYYLR